MPVLFGRDGNLGVFIAFAMVPIACFLIYRTTLGFEIRTVGANPSAARYAGMSPRRLIILTLSLCGLFAGLAGSDRDPEHSATTRPCSGRRSGSPASPSRSSADRTRSASLLAALLLGGMRAGAPAMQIEADIPIEIIDVIQGLILLFLAAEVVIRRAFRIRAGTGTPDELQDELQTVSRSYGESSA